jgi:hypothetical protein
VWDRKERLEHRVHVIETKFEKKRLEIGVIITKRFNERFRMCVTHAFALNTSDREIDGSNICSYWYVSRFFSIDSRRGPISE